MADFNWQLREYLHYLHGGQLQVLMSLYLHRNHHLRARPGRETIMKETGLSSAVVTAAIAGLKRLKAIVLVPYDKRIGDEQKLSPRQYVYQLTGVLSPDEQTIVRYLYMPPDAWDDLKAMLDHLGDCLFSKHLIVQNLNNSEFKHEVYTVKEEVNTKDSVTGVETPITAAVETPQPLPPNPDLAIGLSNPPPEAAPPPPKPRKANPVFDAVAQYGFGIQPGQAINGAGGRIGKIVGWLKNSAPDTTPADLIRFYGWYQREYPGISAPRDVVKFGEHFTMWLQTAEAKIPNVGKIGGADLAERIRQAKARPVTLAWNSASDNSMEEM